MDDVFELLLKDIDDVALTMEDMLKTFTHEQFCFMFAVKTLNEMVKMGILSGGQYALSERGIELLKLYWKDEKPSEKDIKLGMDLVMGADMI